MILFIKLNYHYSMFFKKKLYKYRVPDTTLLFGYRRYRSNGIFLCVTNRVPDR